MNYSCECFCEMCECSHLHQCKRTSENHCTNIRANSSCQCRLGLTVMLGWSGGWLQLLL